MGPGPPSGPPGPGNLYRLPPTSRDSIAPCACCTNTQHCDCYLHRRFDDVNEARYRDGRRAYPVDNEAKHTHPQGAAKNIHHLVHNFDYMIYLSYFIYSWFISWWFKLMSLHSAEWRDSQCTLDCQVCGRKWLWPNLR
jgi:hypothetical protein